MREIFRSAYSLMWGCFLFSGGRMTGYCILVVSWQGRACSVEHKLWSTSLHKLS